MLCAVGVFQPGFSTLHMSQVLKDIENQGHIWLVVEPYPSEKYELVNWDDEISQCMEK